MYVCDDCEIEFETIQGINDLACTDCPYCLKVTNHRIPQIFTAIDKTPKTLGGLADQRRKELGNIQYNDIVQKMANERTVEYKGKLPEGCEQIKPTEERPFWRKDLPIPDYSLNKMTPEQTTRYIIEGKKPIISS